MPLTTQRRNTAYLNPLNERPAAWMGLAVYLAGSLEPRFRPDHLAGKVGARPLRLGAAVTKG